MPASKIYKSILQAKKRGKKGLGLLIDPDKTEAPKLERLIRSANHAGVDYVLVGSSLLIKGGLDRCITIVKDNTDIPVLLFPGNTLQLSDQADGILFLSLISGRNPELLIGRQVIAAPYLRRSALEILPTGYMLIEGGKTTSAVYMSNTTPIPRDKTDIALCTAMAGEMLGLKLIYMDAGSGAKQSIGPEMIEAVRQTIDIPLITGGGLRTPVQAFGQAKAGADLLIVGNAMEKDPGLLAEMAEAVHRAGSSISSLQSINNENRPAS